MTLEKKKDIFDYKWDLLINKIHKNTQKHDNRKSIKINDFYITRAKVDKTSSNYDCLVCYKDWSQEVHVPATSCRPTRVIILKSELLDYYQNGWNKEDEITNYEERCKQHFDTKKYLQKTQQFCEEALFLQSCQGIRDCKRERLRLLHEKRCVKLLLKYFELLK